MKENSTYVPINKQTRTKLKIIKRELFYDKLIHILVSERNWNSIIIAQMIYINHYFNCHRDRITHSAYIRVKTKWIKIGEYHSIWIQDDEEIRTITCKCDKCQ